MQMQRSIRVLYSTLPLNRIFRMPQGSHLSSIRPPLRRECSIRKLKHNPFTHLKHAVYVYI